MHSERLAKSGMSGDEDVSALAKENYELKMLVDEKSSELEDRNVLLVKAGDSTDFHSHTCFLLLL